MGRPPIGKHAMTAAERQRRHRAKLPAKPRRRWQVLPPEGQGECDWDPELEPAHAGEKASITRRNIAAYQTAEAIRLAQDYALLRPGTQPQEVNKARIKEVTAAANAWVRLCKRLKKGARHAAQPPSAVARGTGARAHGSGP